MEQNTLKKELNYIKKKEAQLSELKNIITKYTTDNSNTEEELKPNALTISYSIVEELMKEVVFDMVVDAIVNYQQININCTFCKKNCLSEKYINKYINNLPKQVDEANTYDCHNCSKKFPSARFTSHLEKCLGLIESRNSKRIAASKTSDKRFAGFKNLNLSNAYESDAYNNASLSDNDIITKKDKNNRFSKESSVPIERERKRKGENDNPIKRLKLNIGLSNKKDNELNNTDSNSNEENSTDNNDLITGEFEEVEIASSLNHNGI